MKKSEEKLSNNMLKTVTAIYIIINTLSFSAHVYSCSFAMVLPYTDVETGQCQVFFNYMRGRMLIFISLSLFAIPIAICISKMSRKIGRPTQGLFLLIMLFYQTFFLFTDTSTSLKFAEKKHCIHLQDSLNWNGMSIVLNVAVGVMNISITLYLLIIIICCNSLLHSTCLYNYDD